jgi:hypothetical protein
MMMIQCNAMSMPVHEDDAPSGGANVSSSSNATMAWTDTEAEERRKVLVARVDPVTGATVVTEERTVPPLPLTGTKAERRYMERKWCEKLWRAMPRVQRRKSLDVARVLERAAKRQCKKRKDEVPLRAKDEDWRAHVFDPECADSVTRKAALVKECLDEARALAQNGGEKLPWLECLPKGIRESARLAAHLRRWGERGAKTGEFMVERAPQDEDEISTDDEE